MSGREKLGTGQGRVFRSFPGGGAFGDPDRLPALLAHSG